MLFVAKIKEKGVFMFDEFEFKTELHAHTSPVSSCSEILPRDMIEVYEKNGYTSLAITNHFTYADYFDKPKEKIDSYIEGYEECRRLGEKKGINVILGAELRFSENFNDYLIYGISPEELYNIARLLDDGIDKFYKEYSNDKNVIFQAHPFRDGMEEVSPKSLDGIEVFNLHPSHNSRIGYAARYAREHGLRIIAGTDFHHPGMGALSGILTKEPVTDSFLLAKILKDGEYIIEASGYKIIPE